MNSGNLYKQQKIFWWGLFWVWDKNLLASTCWRNILLCLSEVSAMLPLRIKGSGSYFWMAGVQIEGLKYLVVRRLCSPPDSLYILYVWTKFSPLHRVSLQRQRDIQKTEKATPLKKQTKKNAASAWGHVTNETCSSCFTTLHISILPLWWKHQTAWMRTRNQIYPLSLLKWARFIWIAVE